MKKLYANLFEANKSHQENWNRLITRLRKEAKDERVKELVRKNPEFLKAKVPENLIVMPGDGEMAAYEFSSDILTPHSQKSLESFLEASYSFQCRTRAARIHEGLQGRNESDSQYFKRIQIEQMEENASIDEIRAAAEELAKDEPSLKLPYICVREYQKNGNVHYHVIIFGISYLARYDKLRNIWAEYNQGHEVNVTAIRFDSQQGFVWEAGQAPKDSQGMQPMEYLKKYLLKGQYSADSGSMYWLNASRFYTYSQSILSDENRPRKIISKGLYEFAGVILGDYWTWNGETFVCIEPVGPPQAAAAGSD